MMRKTYIYISLLAAIVSVGLIMGQGPGFARSVEAPPTPVSDEDHDPVGAFASELDDFSGDIRAFPEEYEMFDMNDQKVGLTFGEDEPWRLINFWATWCAPCVVEMPSLKALQEKMAGREDIEILLVSTDMADDAAALEAKMKKVKMPDITYHYVKDGYLWQRFEMEGLPSTYLVSPRGMIMYTFVGDADWASPKAEAFLNYVLK